MENNRIIELLENRYAILKEHIERDKKNYNDPFLSQHARGRVAVEENWLEEVERLLKEIRR